MHARLRWRLAATAPALLLAALMMPAQATTTSVAAGGASTVAGCSGGGVCITVAGDRAVGPARRVAQGFAYGIDGTSNPVYVNALGARSWLLGANTSAYQPARAQGASVLYFIDADWQASVRDAAGHKLLPWQHLHDYFAFIANDVRAIEASGLQVDYWEIQNEPDGQYIPGGPRPTPAEALAWFSTGVAALRSVDPAARVTGPQLSAFNDQPGSPTLDMVTFLDYVVAHRIRVDAISWHEVGARANTIDNAPDPSSAVVNMGRLQRLLAARPTLGHPAIMISEYGAEAHHLIPGWDVGWIDALEAAGVDAAGRGCWHQADAFGKKVAECNEGGLDGLIVPGLGLPEAGYWVHWAYAQMAGSRVATQTSDSAFSAFATVDPNGSTLRVLIGRHQSCTPQIRADCHQPASSTPPPAAVEVAVTVPWGSPSLVAVEEIPNVTGVVLTPTPITTQTLATTGNKITIPLSNVADGAAYYVTLTAVG